MENRKSLILLLFYLLSLVLWLCACTKDTENTCHVTFESDVQALMVKSCAYAGCHSGPTASPYVPASAKDFTTYEGLIQTVVDGSFAKRAVEQLSMPPAAFVPQDKPATLTADEIKLLKCWLDNDYPEF